jgi:hypothetical protein
MRPLRFRLLLPLVFGCLALALTAWEFHNERVIASVGMGWDTGPPIWPYQTSWILLQAINAPAYALDLPLFLLLGVTTDARLLLGVEVPTIFLWWWFIGWRIDFGLLPQREVRQRGLWGAVLGVASLGFWSCATYLVLQQVKFWSEYGERGWSGPMLFLMRHAGILWWCLLLGFWSAAATVRVATSFRDRNSVSPLDEGVNS